MKSINLPSGFGNIDVVILDHCTNITFLSGDDNNTVRQRDTTWYRVNKMRRGGIQEIDIYEQSTFEKPVSISALAVYPDGKEWNLRSKEIHSSREPLNNTITYTFVIPNYQVGMLVRVEVEREHLHPEFTGRFLFRQNFAAIRSSITFTHPKAANLRYGIENGEKAGIDDSFMIQGETKTISYTSQKLPPIRQSDRTQSPEAFYAALYISFPPEGDTSYSWSKLGDHYLNAVGHVYAINNEIRQEYQLAQDLPSRDKALSLFNKMVQKVRYHSDARGRFAFYSRPAATVFENGFGDCKEMSSLLKALLHYNDVESNLVLLATDNHFQLVEKYPGLYGFNHVILSAAYGDEVHQYFDPTYFFASANTSYYPSIGRKAFFLLPDGRSEISQILPGDDFESSVFTRSVFREEDDLVIEGSVTLSGAPALHFHQYSFQHNGVDDEGLSRKYLQTYLSIPADQAMVDLISKDKVTLTFTASFERNILHAGRGGIKLDFPRPHKKFANPQLTDSLGPIHLSPLSQEDNWTLPFSVNTGGLPPHTSALADAYWKADTNRVTRRYRQRELLLKESNDLDDSWHDYIQSFERNIVWRD